MSAPFLPLLLIFGGIAAIAGGGGSATSSSSSPQGQPRPQQTSGGITWHDGRGSKLSNQQRRENYDAVYLMGKVLEDAGYFGEGFADWLRVVSFTEARGNPAAGSDAFSNAARGMFGFRPTTAWNETPTHNGVPRQWDEASAQIAFNNGAVTAAEVAALKDLPWSVALAAHNVSRLRKYTQGGPYTMLGARRGWAYPSLVPDHDNSQRPELLERWGEALTYFGLPASFGSQSMDVLVPRTSFPHPAQLRELIMSASLGTSSLGRERRRGPSSVDPRKWDLWRQARPPLRLGPGSARRRPVGVGCRYVRPRGWRGHRVRLGRSEQPQPRSAGCQRGCDELGKRHLTLGANHEPHNLSPVHK